MTITKKDIVYVANLAHLEVDETDIETFAGHPGLQQTVRLEENVLVTADGPVVFTMMEHMEEAIPKK